MGTDAATSNQSDRWPVVQTDAGQVTLAALPALQSREAEWRHWKGGAEAQVKILRAQAAGRFVAAGRVLVAGRDRWPVPPDLAATVDRARSLAAEIAADDEREAAFKQQEPTNLFGRIGSHHHEHELERERSQVDGELASLAGSIARSAPATTVPEADQQRRAASDLEAQADALEAELQVAVKTIAALDDEIGRRRQSTKAMGFDALYEAALLQTSGAPPVDSPLILKRGEQAYLSLPATLAGMATQTSYVGGSRGFSFPIGHTGIRYRVGSYSGHPVQRQYLKEIDTGTFVITNQRLAYVGATRSSSVALDKLLHVQVYDDGLSVSREGKGNADLYLLANPKHVLFLLNWVLSRQTATS